MAAVLRAVLLLLPLLAASFTSGQAVDCGSVNQTLPVKDLHRIFGDWVLVWSVADNVQGWSILPNVSSSHVELRLSADNRTVELIERNVYTHQTCVTYKLNSSMPAEDAEDSVLQMEPSVFVKDGVVEQFNDTATARFYNTCPDCLLMVYKGNLLGGFLLSYRREGTHQDPEHLKAIDHEIAARCLGFPDDNAFIYDGKTDFCHKKTAVEAVKS